MAATLSSCPMELLCDIAEYLSLPDQISLGKASKHLHASLLAPSRRRVEGNFYFTMTKGKPSFIKVTSFDHTSNQARGTLWSAVKMQVITRAGFDEYGYERYRRSIPLFHPDKEHGKSPIKLNMTRSYLFGVRHIRRGEEWRYKLFTGAIDAYAYMKSRQHHLPNSLRERLEVLEDKEIPRLQKIIRSLEKDLANLGIEFRRKHKELDTTPTRSIDFLILNEELDEIEKTVSELEAQLGPQRKLLGDAEYECDVIRHKERMQARSRRGIVASFDERKGKNIMHEIY